MMIIMTTLMSVNCIHVSGAIKMNHNYMGTANPSLEKQPTFCDPNGFLSKWRLRNKCRISIPRMCYYPDLFSAPDFSRACGKFASANEKHYPNLGSDAMCLFLTCQFAGKPMVALQHLKLNSPVQIKSLFNYPSLSLLQIGDLLSPC